MFWKVIGGVMAFFGAVFLALALVVVAALTMAGVAVGSLVESLDVSTVQVTDANGVTESYTIEELANDPERLEIYGTNGEQVTIDLSIPQITIKEGGANGEQVVIASGSSVTVSPDVPQIRIDGRDFDNFDGDSLWRPIGSFFRGLFNLVTWALIIGCLWLLFRKRPETVQTPVEKKMDATA